MKTIKGESKKMSKCVKDPVRVKAAKKAWVTIRANQAKDHGRAVKKKDKSQASLRHQAPLDNFGVFGPKDKNKNKKIDNAVGTTEWSQKKSKKTIKEIVKDVKQKVKTGTAVVKSKPDWHVAAAKKAWKTIRRNKALKHKRMSEIATKRWADMKKKVK